MNKAARIRPATPDDAAALADLVNMAGEGLPLYLWTKMAQAGEDPWQVGKRRALRDEGSFSWRNATVAECGGKVAACLIGYKLPDRPEPVDQAMPPMFVPLQELENLASGTWYVNVLASYPAERGRGHGTSLLTVAERLASQAGATGLSIIVSDANEGARRLYERCGFREAASRAIVKEDWQHAGKNWVLLLKNISGNAHAT